MSHPMLIPAPLEETPHHRSRNTHNSNSAVQTKQQLTFDGPNRRASDGGGPNNSAVHTANGQFPRRGSNQGSQGASSSSRPFSASTSAADYMYQSTGEINYGIVDQLYNRESFKRLTALTGPNGTRGRDSRVLTKDLIQELVQQGFSSGLARALSENVATFDFRFWVVDNSGSMQIGDGHRIVATGKKGLCKAVPSTRWEEIQDAVKYHAQMAGLLDSPTIFKLLNDPGLRTGPQQFSVGERGDAFTSSEIEAAINTMKKVKPGGVTPLTRHIWDIQQSISEMAPALRRNGKKVAIILATDGLPTDEQGYGGQDVTEEFVRSLRALEGLPVWLVVRLCTDEEPVTHFYNSLDIQLELSLEVLDDYVGEAREVHAKNPWICYGLPLHRCRELGYHDRLFDIIDERPLTKGEVRSFCCLILGIDDEEELPDPAVNFGRFVKEVKARLIHEKPQWNPMKKKMTPWILTSKLVKSFSQRPCVIL